MAGYRLKLRLIIFGFILVITTIATYEVLVIIRALHIFGQLEVEDFPGRPHPQQVDVTNPNKLKNIANINNAAFLINKKWDDIPLGKSHGDHKLNQFSGARQKKQKCNATITILVPDMYPFKAWREYHLYWEKFLHRSTIANTDLITLHLLCPRQKCDVDIRVTTEEAYLNTSDAIVVNMFPNILKSQLLDLLSHLRQVLHPNVHWFFYGVESPQMMTYWDTNIGNIQYHHSITYHSKADIRLPYGEYLPNNPPRKTGATAQDWSANKTALIAWMASNCKNTFWPRNEFVQELAKHIPVDTYGQCGTLTCLPAMSENCTRLMAGYKFYLSLENAECDEYITEKLWSNSLHQGVVPVVYGGRKEAYERLLPPKSFIHISDFDSVQSLASYLKILDRDKNMYNMYHAWRKHGRVATVYPPLDSKVFCKIVPFVSRQPPSFRMVKNSAYYRSCKGLTGTFTEEGSLKSFIPWK